MSEPVKKRSLGSYLSRLEERREEREKSEQQQREISQSVDSANSGPTLKDVANEEELPQSALPAIRSETKQQPPIDSVSVRRVNTPETADGDISKNENSTTLEQPHIKEQEIPTELDQDSHQSEEKPHQENNDDNDDDERTVPKVGRHRGSDEEYSSALSEVESDAPTEPASPPRPKMGRLIRGDQLESANNSRQSSAPVLAHDGESESDLSDLDDARTAKISSSAIHEDSSPVKHQNDLKRKASNLEHSPSQKKNKHLTDNRMIKTKKGVHRDAGGRTKLQIACDKGKYDLAKKLIEEDGYDVNDQDNAGNTPLHEAALNGHSAIVQLLMKNGANVNIQSYDMFLDTPLIDASANGHINVVKYLLDHGADPTMVNAKGLSAIESIEKDSDMDDEDRKIVHDMKDMLKRATRKYVKHSHRNLQSSSLSRHSDDVEKQLTHDDDFYWTDISSKVGKSKLLRASKEGKLAYVGSYLENGGRPDFRCFIESCIYGHDDVVSLFLAFGAQVNMCNKEGQTPLMLSVGRGHVNVVKLLIEAGADLQKTDKSKKTALHYANHSSLGITDPAEIQLLKDVVKKQYGYELSNSDDQDDEREESEDKNTASEETSLAPSMREEEPAPLSSSIKGHHSPISASELKIESNHDEDNRTTSDLQRKTEAVVNIRPPLYKADSKSSSSASLQHRYKSASPTHQISDSPTPSKESEEERAARLKSEEEYRQKRLQQKKRKEQEFLHRLAEDERKRVEEKEKLKLQELKRLEDAKKEELLRQEELRNKKEVEKRLKIRERYPIGLRVINYKDLENYEKFGPVYYFIEDGTKWVLDLQLSAILKLSTEDLQKRSVNYKKVEDTQYPQLWNLYKPIFLYGGNDNAREFNALPWSQQSEIDQTEYAKFCELPLTWVQLSELKLEASNSEINEWIQNNLLEFIPALAAAPAALNRTRARLQNVTRNEQNEQHSRSRLLPAKFQSRSKLLPWLNATKALW